MKLDEQAFEEAEEIVAFKNPEEQYNHLAKKFSFTPLYLPKNFSYGFIEFFEKEPPFKHIDPESGTILNAPKGNKIFNLGGKDNKLSAAGKRILENTLRRSLEIKKTPDELTQIEAVEFTVNFNAERKRCLRQKVLFEDPTFPADDRSIFKDPTLPETEQSNFQRKFQDCVWHRPNKIVEEPQFFVSAQSRFDVKQGGLGDCYLVASVATLAMREELFYRVVPVDQSFTDNYAGIFHFQFWRFDQWVDVVIDDRLPTKDGKLVFARSEEKNEFWSALLEKAYAKFYGGYEHLMGGSLSDVMEDITGGIIECYRIEECNKLVLRGLMEMAFDTGSMVNCGTGTEGVEESKCLFTKHAYSCTGFAKVHHDKLGVVQLVRIRNPWGSKLQWTGAWGDVSEEWNHVSDAEKKNLEVVIADDGEFWMSFDDFFREFATVNVCTLTKDCIEDICRMVGGKKIAQKIEWNSSCDTGHWSPNCGVSGDNVLAALFSNPQYLLHIKQKEKEKGRRTPIIIELQQKCLRGKQVSNYIVIGFFLFECGYQSEKLTLNNLPSNIRNVAHPEFIKARQLTRRIFLTDGYYVIVPATYQQGNDLDFRLRVVSNCNITIR